MSKNQSCWQRGLVRHPRYLQFFMTDITPSSTRCCCCLPSALQPSVERALPDSDAPESSPESLHRQLSHQICSPNGLHRTRHIPRCLLYCEEFVPHYVLQFNRGFDPH